MALQIFNQLDRKDAVSNKAWLKRAIQAAIKEYHTVWMAEPRLDPKTGLSRYRPHGKGIPPETEAKTSSSTYSAGASLPQTMPTTCSLLHRHAFNTTNI